MHDGALTAGELGGNLSQVTCLQLLLFQTHTRHLARTEIGLLLQLL